LFFCDEAMRMLWASLSAGLKRVAPEVTVARSTA